MKFLNTLSACFVASAFIVSAASADDTPLVYCKKDLMPVGGPKTEVEVSRTAAGDHRATIRTTVNSSGSVSVKSSEMSSLQCDNPKVSPGTDGAMRFDRLSCQATPDVSGGKTGVSIVLDQTRGTYDVLTSPRRGSKGDFERDLEQSRHNSGDHQFTCTLNPGQP